MVITVFADALASHGRLLALNTILHMFSVKFRCLSVNFGHLRLSDDATENTWCILTKYRWALRMNFYRHTSYLSEDGYRADNIFTYVVLGKISEFIQDIDQALWCSSSWWQRLNVIDNGFVLARCHLKQQWTSSPLHIHSYDKKW